jgi:hypothetical protein
MKTISPIQTWINGQAVTATIFNTYVSNGILGISSTFYYCLYDDMKSIVAEGYIIMSGNDYEAWGNDDEYAWNWAANTLNLTITGNYIPPTPFEEITTI